MEDETTRRIIGAALEVHKRLGPGLLESIYEEALCHELDLCGMVYGRQVAVDVVYKEKVISGQVLDLVVDSNVVVELKSVRRLPEVALAQTLSYLKATGLHRALLINFGERRLSSGIRRISL